MQQTGASLAITLSCILILASAASSACTVQKTLQRQRPQLARFCCANAWHVLHRQASMSNCTVASSMGHTSLSYSSTDCGLGCCSWRCSAARMRSSSSCFARFRWRFVSGCTSPPASSAQYAKAIRPLYFYGDPKAIASLGVRLIMMSLKNACLGCLRHLLAEPSHQKRMHGSKDTRSGPCSWLQKGLDEACRARRKVCNSESVIAGQRMECFMNYCQKR